MAQCRAVLLSLHGVGLRRAEVRGRANAASMEAALAAFAQLPEYKRTFTSRLYKNKTPLL